MHFFPKDAKRFFFQDTWTEYYKFAFVRNPWDRAVSLYEYHKSISYGLFQNVNASHIAARMYSFEEWVLVNHRSNRKSNWFGVPQSAWLEDIDRVYMFEEYGTAFAEIAMMLGQNIEAPHINGTPHRDFRNYYVTEEVIDIIAEIDRDVIQKYGYHLTMDDCT